MFETFLEIAAFESQQMYKFSRASKLTHWGWVTHICFSKLTIIRSDNGFSPGRHQAIILKLCWDIANPWEETSVKS